LIDNILDQHALRRRLLAIATHNDQAVVGEPRALGECDGILQVIDDRMAVVGSRLGVMTCQFKAGVAVDENQELAAERQKRNERVRPKAAFAR
jgi:uncharacterized membrane-anchored protein